MLRRELEARGGSGNIPPHGNQNANLSQPPPPAIGLGPSNLFGTIMSQGSGQGGPGLAPPPTDSQQQQQPPPHQIPPPNIPQIPQQTPQGPTQQQQPGQHYNQQGGFGAVKGNGSHQQGMCNRASYLVYRPVTDIISYSLKVIHNPPLHRHHLARA